MQALHALKIQRSGRCFPPSRCCMAAPHSRRLPWPRLLHAQTAYPSTVQRFRARCTRGNLSTGASTSTTLRLRCCRPVADTMHAAPVQGCCRYVGLPLACGAATDAPCEPGLSLSVAQALCVGPPPAPHARQRPRRPGLRVPPMRPPCPSLISCTSSEPSTVAGK